MSTNAITSSLLSTIFDSSSTANQFATNLNRLAKDLQSGNLSGAQQDYVTLSKDLQDAAGSTSAGTSAGGVTVSLLSDISGSASSLSSFTKELNQIGTDLHNGDLGSAQKDLVSLDSTAGNAASSINSGSTVGSPTSRSNATTLIRSIVQALSAGDSSSASLGLSQLASVSTSAKGAGYLEQLSGSLGSSSASSTSSVSQLVQSANTNSANSTLSLLA